MYYFKFLYIGTLVTPLVLVSLISLAESLILVEMIIITAGIEVYLLLLAGFQGIGVPNSWISFAGSRFCHTSVCCWKGEFLDMLV